MTETKKVGRPPGRGQVAELRAKLIDGHLPKIIEKLVELALAGDVSAAKALLDRAIPAMKAQAAPVSLPVPAGTLTEKALALLTAALDGSLPPDIASELITALSRIVSIEQATELKARLDALEYKDIA